MTAITTGGLKVARCYSHPSIQEGLSIRYKERASKRYRALRSIRKSGGYKVQLNFWKMFKVWIEKSVRCTRVVNLLAGPSPLENLGLTGGCTTIALEKKWHFGKEVSIRYSVSKFFGKEVSIRYSVSKFFGKGVHLKYNGKFSAK